MAQCSCVGEHPLKNEILLEAKKMTDLAKVEKDRQRAARQKKFKQERMLKEKVLESI
jgi:hypothetical protein